MDWLEVQVVELEERLGLVLEDQVVELKDQVVELVSLGLVLEDEPDEVVELEDQVVEQVVGQEGHLGQEC